MSEDEKIVNALLNITADEPSSAEDAYGLVSKLSKEGWEEFYSHSEHTPLERAVLAGNVAAAVGFIEYNQERAGDMQSAPISGTLYVVKDVSGILNDGEWACNKGGSILHFAVENNASRRMMQTLVDLVDVNHLDDKGRTPLDCAVSEGRDELADCLREAGGYTCDEVAGECFGIKWRNAVPEDVAQTKHVNRGGRFHGEPIHWAARFCASPRVINALVQNGADVETDSYMLKYSMGLCKWVRHAENKPIHLAVRHNPAVLQALIDAGADVNAFNGKGYLPLHLAAFRHKRSAVGVLADAGADINRRADKDSLTALHLAARTGDTETADVLLNAQADVNLTDNNGEPPLFGAVRKNCVALVDALIQAGAELNMANKERLTAMHLAARLDYADIIGVMAQAGADVDKCADENRAPVHLAAKDGRTAAVRALLKAGANIQQADLAGDTALHMAAVRGHENIVEMLIGAGADVNSKNQLGKSPLGASLQAGYYPHAQIMLIESGAAVNTDDEDIINHHCLLHVAVKKCRVNAIPALISAGADVNLARERGLTPLIFAVKYGCAQAASILLQAGANVNHQDIFGMTALHHAKSLKVAGVADVLIQHGADIHLKDSDGKTPADY